MSSRERWEFHAFGRCITLINLRGCRYVTPFFRFLRDGGATEWPWWEIRVGRLDLIVSRVHPRA